MVSGKFYMVGVFTLMGIVFLCLTAIVLAGKDTTNYLVVIAPAVTTLLSLLVVSKQVDSVQHSADAAREKIEKVEHQTNGALAAQFEDLKTHIDKATDNV